MRILGIETSCDETAIAIVNLEGDLPTVEKSVVLSQIQTHEKYGGVVPEVAAREHLQALFPLLEREVARDGSGIDAIAVTAGPGLAPALRVGVEAAKTLAWAWNKPLVPVNHLEGHIYAAWLSSSGRGDPALTASPMFPALCLLVSGGHTELILMKNHGEYKRLGETLDDAAGEAFDKVAQMLGLPYPGGPHVAKLAEEGERAAYAFPRALMDRAGFDFSFAGLKTSVLYTLRGEPDANKADVAASFQEAVVDALVKKALRAGIETKPACVILAGGVAANKALRTRLAEVIGAELQVPVFVPPFEYSMDNAAMIAVAGAFRARDAKNFVDPLTLIADPNMDLGL